jgi:hypothetical protein
MAPAIATRLENGRGVHPRMRAALGFLLACNALLLLFAFLGLVFRCRGCNGLPVTLEFPV